ncbi:MAG: hypothetical protein A3F11_07280 [Gammaproteobacteria bacterium RIFCSPHIGHO2_12_FULL_37_14]|nr:MAG: hypothetical protein A3F11_07280 [Gammaproteobacteria bacterium RIFCSPHIGHO2_12_FULL_37_14]
MSKKSKNPQSLEACSAFNMTGDLNSASVVLFSEIPFFESLTMACWIAIQHEISQFRHVEVFTGIDGSVSTNDVGSWNGRVSLCTPGFCEPKNDFTVTQYQRISRDCRDSWEYDIAWYQFRQLIEKAIPDEIKARLGSRLKSCLAKKSDDAVECLEQELHLDSIDEIPENFWLEFPKLLVTPLLKKWGYTVSAKHIQAIVRSTLEEMLRDFKLVDESPLYRCLFKKDRENFFTRYFSDYFQNLRDEAFTMPRSHRNDNAWEEQLERIEHKKRYYFSPECHDKNNVEIVSCNLEHQGEALLKERSRLLRLHIEDQLWKNHQALERRNGYSSAFFTAQSAVANPVIEEFLEKELPENLVVFKMRNQ